jgi:hypothetical protein
MAGRSAEDCYDRVMAWRKANPNAGWKDIFTNVPNHYSSPVSLCGAMSQVENKRARRDFEFDHKYPLGPLTRGLPEWSIFYNPLWERLYSEQRPR